MFRTRLLLAVLAVSLLSHSLVAAQGDTAGGEPALIPVFVPLPTLNVSDGTTAAYNEVDSKTGAAGTLQFVPAPTSASAVGTATPAATAKPIKSAGTKPGARSASPTAKATTPAAPGASKAAGKPLPSPPPILSTVIVAGPLEATPKQYMNSSVDSRLITAKAPGPAPAASNLKLTIEAFLGTKNVLAELTKKLPGKSAGKLEDAGPCANPLLPYAQCGPGGDLQGSCCPIGWTCVAANEYYSQCLPGAPAPPPAPPAPIPSPPPPPAPQAPEAIVPAPPAPQVVPTEPPPAPEVTPAATQAPPVAPPTTKAGGLGSFADCSLGTPCPPGQNCPHCCGNGVCDVNTGENCSTCPQDCQKADGSPCARVGMFYSGWHWPSWNAQLATTAMGKPVLNMEDVLRSRVESPTGGSGYTLDDILIGNGLLNFASNMHWMHKPADGYYCIYRQRAAGDLHYNVNHEGYYLQYPNQPDCVDVSATLKRHAQQLVAAGVDFIVIDGTNLPQYDNTADGMQLRPFEVMLEEWSALRAQGIQTPDLAYWGRIPAMVSGQSPFGYSDHRTYIYPYVLDTYNVPAWDRMIFRNPHTGNKIFYFFDTQPVDYDVQFLGEIQYNNGLNNVEAIAMGIEGQSRGAWSFFAYCPNEVPTDQMTSNACNQRYATSTLQTLGSQIAVSPSYQLTYGSLPWRSPGLYRGISFQKQFQTVFAAQPDYIMLSSWNEYLALPLNPVADPGTSMGLETDPTAVNQAFTDLFGAEFSRDIEPSAEYGDTIYQMMASCLRVFRSGSTTCDNPDEVCCTIGKWSDFFQIYSDGNPADSFGMYTQNFGGGPRYLPLYKCLPNRKRKLLQSDGTFFSTSSTCEGIGHGADLVGYISATKGGETLRALRRCGGTYTLLTQCNNGQAAPDTVLGYVR